VSLDGPAEWLDHPTVEGQWKSPHLIKVVKVETRIFDLGNADQLQAYNQLLTETSDLNSSPLHLIFSERQFCQNSENWKVIVGIHHLKFRRMTPKTIKKDESSNETLSS
jgi:hypothetical protein